MIVITDANIFYSALITPKGTVAEVLAEHRTIQFLAPSFVIEEVHKYINDIAIYTEKSNKEITSDFKKLLKGIKVIDIETIPEKLVKEALRIVSDIDVDDTFFVALYLHQKHRIWTGDRALIKGLKLKGYDICITTAQLKQHIYKKTKF